MRAPAVRWRGGVIPWSLIAAVAMLALVEATLSRLGCDSMTVPGAGFQFARKSCRDGAKCRILCFGDSQAKTGFLPRVVESRSGLSTYNLSIAGGLAPATYFAFRRALREGAAPSAIVVDFNPALLEVPPFAQSSSLAGLCDLGDVLEHARTAKSAQYLGILLAEHLVPSFRNRAPIRSRILASFRSEGREADNLRQVLWRNWEANLGTWVVPANATGGVLSSLDAKMDRERSSGHYLNRWYVEELLKLASRRKIAVYWLLAPYAPQTQRDRERLGGDAAWAELVRNAQRRYPGLVVLDARRAGFDDSCFFDPVHLNLKGSEGLSAAIGTVLRLRAQGIGADERWIPLRRPEARPDDAPLVEDTNQSEVALRRAEGARRL